MKEITFADLLKLPEGTMFTTIKTKYADVTTWEDVAKGITRSAPIQKRMIGVYRKVRNSIAIPPQDAVIAYVLLTEGFGYSESFMDGTVESFAVLEGDDPSYPDEYRSWYAVSQKSSEEKNTLPSPEEVLIEVLDMYRGLNLTKEEATDHMYKVGGAILSRVRR